MCRRGFSTTCGIIYGRGGYLEGGRKEGEGRRMGRVWWRGCWYRGGAGGGDRTALGDGEGGAVLAGMVAFREIVLADGRVVRSERRAEGNGGNNGGAQGGLQ